MDLMLKINPVCAAKCEDCGISVILDPSFVSVFKLDEEYMAVTICFWCERPLVSSISSEFAKLLSERNVVKLLWRENE